MRRNISQSVKNERTTDVRGGGRCRLRTQRPFDATIAFTAWPALRGAYPRPPSPAGRRSGCFAGLTGASQIAAFGPCLFCAVDHFYSEAQLPRMSLAHVCLTIGLPLGVEIAQDRGSASPAPRHRTRRAVAAGPNFHFPRLAHRYFFLRRGSSEATHCELSSW